MRVTIDATSALLRSAGVKSYAYHWIRHLRLHAGADQIRLFPWLREFGELNHESSTLSLWQTLPRLGMVALANLPGSPALEWMVAGSDVFHASNQVRRAPCGVKLTATVHDFTTWLMPELHTSANIRADRSYAENILRRADRLIAVSENTRQDAIRLAGVSPDRIETIHSGVPEEYFDAVATPRARPYVLYVGTVEPRKNLETLLDAWRQVRADLRGAFDLVVAGPEGWNAAGTVARLRQEAVYLGYVPESNLPGLVAGATAFAYPSLYEGFGFPVAQAMAGGVAVVTSNSSCLPEIVGDAALLVDPRSAEEIAAALEKLLESETLRRELSERGRLRAELYRWEHCAAKSLELFRKVVG